MHLKHLSLTHFRNYGRLELKLPKGTILLHGDNAQGKTNLLEAITYLATTRSPYTNQDQQLINWDADLSEEPIVVSRLVGEVETNAGMQLVELRLIKERRNQFQSTTFRREALVNKRKVRLMDLLGTLRVTLFVPEDIQIITGAPVNRRRYMDIAFCQTDRYYCQTLSTYNKVLDQRNALLRQIQENGSGKDVLPIYTERLVELGSQIFFTRAKHMANLGQTTTRIYYETLTDRKESLRLAYLPRIQSPDNDNEWETDNAEWMCRQSSPAPIAEKFQQALATTEKIDLPSSTKLGPHRDNWQLLINSRPLSDYGSRGQQRSAMLGLKLAEIEWMEQQTGDKPTLLLDEVVAELDQHRRALLLSAITEAHQAVVTATDPTMFTPPFLQTATLFMVANGRVQQDTIT